MADRRRLETSPAPLTLRVQRRNGLLTPHALRRLARAIADRFQPDQIILFGSYACGEPTPDSDVDLLVVMPAQDESAQAVRVRQAFWLPFSWDVIVRTPQRLQRRLQWGDTFLRDVVTRGKVLYEKITARANSSQAKSLNMSRGNRRPSAPLPAHLRPLFWDYDFKVLRWKTDHDLIIGRVLSAGGLEAWKWLRRRLGDPDLRAWLIRRQGAGLSRKQIRFWEFILELPHREVNAWLAKPERRVWDGRMHS